MVLTYRRAMILVLIALAGVMAYDAWWVAKGQFGIGAYLPGIYPVFCILMILGLRFAKARGLWESSRFEKSK